MHKFTPIQGFKLNNNNNKKQENQHFVISLLLGMQFYHIIFRYTCIYVSHSYHSAVSELQFTLKLKV